MKRHLLSILPFLLLATTVLAQQGPVNTAYVPKLKQHPLELGFAMGLNNLSLSGGEGGNFRTGVQPSVELNYYYPFNKSWSLRTGLNLAFGHASFRGDSYEFSEQVTLHSTEMANFEAIYHYFVPTFSEQYNYLQANIPVMAVWKNESIHASAGMKLGLPIFRSGSYRTQEVTYYTEFPEFGSAINETDEGVYSGTLPEREKRYSGRTYKMPVWVMLSAEVGYMFQQGVRRNVKSRISLYFDWSVTKCKTDSDNGFITPSNYYPTYHTFTNCMNSNMIEKYGLMTYGIKYSIKL